MLPGSQQMIAVTLRGVLKRFGGVPAVDDVSLDVFEGEFLTLLGPSGCGKTTTLRCIAGFVRPDAGRVLITGRDVTDVAPHRRNIGMVFQSYALFPHMSVLGNVTYGLRVRGVGKSTIAKKAEAALDLVRLSELGPRRVHELSGGQQQRVALARALVYEPSVLLLDEPLSNLDAKLRAEMRVDIRNLQKRLGTTMIYVTHDQEEALSVSDRIAVMNVGRIEQLATPSEIYDKPQTPFVADFIGVSSIHEGVVESSSNEATAIIRVSWGQRVTASASTSLPTGARVWLVVRPEHIRLSTLNNNKCASRPDGFRGTVAVCTLLGATMRYRIALPGQVMITADVQRRPGEQAYRSGEEVFVEIVEAAVLPRS